MAVPLLKEAGAMDNRLRDWLADERGQDLIEYMLLASFIGIASWVGVQVLGNAMFLTYSSWDSTTQEVWEVQDPVGP
jgi:Flp pilus assembly pilin Flp